MANSMRIGFTLSNFEEMRQLCRDLPPAVESRVMGDAVKVAAAPIVKAAKLKTPVRTGALRRSITAVVKRYPRAGKVMALIGPDTRYYSKGKGLDKKADRRGADRPANYAHLVEFGHHIAKGGALRDQHEIVSTVITDSKGRIRRVRKKGTVVEKASGTATMFVLPQPFLRPAVMSAGAQAQAELARGVEVGMKREIKRLASKMRRLEKVK